MTRITLALTILSLCCFTAPLQAQPAPDPDPGLPALLQALDACGPADAPCREAALIRLGGAEEHAGQHQEALGHYGEVLELKRQRGDRGGEAATLNNMGVSSAALGDRKRALVYYKQALALYRQLGDPRGEAATLNNIRDEEDTPPPTALPAPRSASGSALAAGGPLFLHASSFVEFGGVGYVIPLPATTTGPATTAGLGGVGVQAGLLIPTFQRPSVDGGVTIHFGSELTVLSGPGGLLSTEAAWVALGFDVGVENLQLGPQVGVGFLYGTLASNGGAEAAAIDGMVTIGAHANLRITPRLGLYVEGDAMNLLVENIWGARILGGFAISIARKRAP